MFIAVWQVGAFNRSMEKADLMQRNAQRPLFSSLNSGHSSGRRLPVHQAEFETKRLRKLSFREWHQSGFQDHRRCLGRREEADQRTSRLGLPDRTGERTRVKNHRLELGRNRADEGNTRDIYQLADLLEADLRLATRDNPGHRLAGWRSSHLSALAHDLVCDAELGEQRRR